MWPNGLRHVWRTKYFTSFDQIIQFYQTRSNTIQQGQTWCQRGKCLVTKGDMYVCPLTRDITHSTFHITQNNVWSCLIAKHFPFGQGKSYSKMAICTSYFHVGCLYVDFKYDITLNFEWFRKCTLLWGNFTKSLRTTRKLCIWAKALHINFI